MRNVIAIAIFILAATCVCLATTKTLHVAEEGDDNNDGSCWGEAFKTPKRAFNIANASDWYFLGYDSLAIVVAGDDTTKASSGTYVLDSTLVWEHQDNVMLHLRAKTGDDVSIAIPDITPTKENFFATRAYQTYETSPCTHA